MTSAPVPDTPTLRYHSRVALAVELMRLGLRTSMVHAATDLPVRLLRQLHHEIHGTAPPRGQHATSPTVLRNRRTRSEGALFINLYLRAGAAPVRGGFDIHTFMTAYRLYLERMRTICQRPEIDANHAWVLARDLHAGLLRQRTCRRCSVRYVYPADQPQIGCPICPTIAAAAGEHGGARVERAGRPD